MKENAVFFTKAKPIFLSGRENDSNIQAGFRKDVELQALPERAAIHITARTLYRLYINDILVMHGPARTAHGFLRVDVLDVMQFLRIGTNYIAIETSASTGCLGGYSNDQTCENSMLLAEMFLNDISLLATDESWDVVQLTQRAEKAEKISHCRQMAEIYTLDPAYAAWRTGNMQTVEELHWEKASICNASPPKLLPRRMKYPSLQKCGGAQLISVRGAYIDHNIKFRPAWFEDIYEDHYKELKERPLNDYVQTVETQLQACARWLEGGVEFTQTVATETPYAFFDLGVLRLGFIGFTVRCERNCILDIVHLEGIREHDDKNLCLGNTNPVTRLHLPAGTWNFLTMEPALVRYLKFYFRPLGTDPVGDCAVWDIHVREFCYPENWRGAFLCSDEDINRLFDAARRTLRLNTLDIFMDCPERERGGWLCDSLWTARAASLIWNDHTVEKAFLENYLLAPYGDGIGAPNNFFPEAYPACQIPGSGAITTWSFWLMLELVEYVERSGDLNLALDFSERVEDFVKGSARYIGTSGLLQDMPNIFIDWSQSNINTQPISTGANALYAFMLLRLGQLYHRDDWQSKGVRIRRVLRSVLLPEGSSDFLEKPFFPDTLEISEDGSLKPGKHFSEACQYTILWAELFAKEEIPVVARAVIRAMGAAPSITPSPQIGASGLFIGLCIRLDLLAKWGEYEALLREMRAIYMPQLREGPGTLWENLELNSSSRCHGFNAHVTVHLIRDILGLNIPKVFDLEKRTLISAVEQKSNVCREAHLCGLRWMRGSVAVGDEIISREEMEPHL